MFSSSYIMEVHSAALPDSFLSAPAIFLHSQLHGWSPQDPLEALVPDAGNDLGQKLSFFQDLPQNTNTILPLAVILGEFRGILTLANTA